MSLPATAGQVALAARVPGEPGGASPLDADRAARCTGCSSRRKHLLEWETAAAAEARLGTGLGSRSSSACGLAVASPSVGLGVLVVAREPGGAAGRAAVALARGCCRPLVA